MAKTLIEKMTEFLDETIAYYSVDPVARRCNNTELGSCWYNPIDAGKEGISEGCAIGRKMNKVQKKKSLQVACTVVLLEQHERGNLLPASLREFPTDFLRNVQSLHDRNTHWNETGLSETGEAFVAQIRKENLTN